MKLTLLCALTRVAVVLFLLPLPATPQAAEPSPKPQFFAGGVTEINDQQIKVSRMLIGRPVETRAFLLNSNTKINRASVKVKARVTVRYRHQPEGDVALEIQLRPAVHSSSKP